MDHWTSCLVASISLYSSNDGWTFQRHSTRQLIPDPCRATQHSQIQLLLFVVPVSTGIRDQYQWLDSDRSLNSTIVPAYPLGYLDRRYSPEMSRRPILVLIPGPLTVYTAGTIAVVSYSHNGPGISAGQLLGYALHLLFLYHLISIKNINTI